MKKRMPSTDGRRLYIAYGSNLNVRQMKVRCPGAVLYGTAALSGYELAFKGSKSGAYLTIVPCKGRKVPAAIWEITPEDEAALDRYEGFPVFYEKKDMEVFVRRKGQDDKPRVRRMCFAYVMTEGAEYALPSDAYVNTCCEGYSAFGFNQDILAAAINRTTQRVTGHRAFKRGAAAIRKTEA